MLRIFSVAFWKIICLDLTPFSEMVENHCWSKKNVNYHNVLLSSQNDQTGYAVVLNKSEILES